MQSAEEERSITGTEDVRVDGRFSGIFLISAILKHSIVRENDNMSLPYRQSR